MTAVETFTPCSPKTQAEIPPVFHISCCDDDDVALCGLDVSDLPFTEGDGEQECTVCFELYREVPSYCPKGRPCSIIKEYLE